MRYQQIGASLCMLAIATLPALAWVESGRAQTMQPTGRVSQVGVQRPQLVHTYVGYEGWLYNFSFSPDGQFLATSHSDGSARIWDWRNFVQHMRFDVDAGSTWYSWVSFLPNGRSLLTSRSDGTIQLVDPASGAPTLTLPGRSNGSGIVTVTADGTTLVDATGVRGDFRIKLWNLETQRERQTLWGNSADLTAITPDGYTLVGASSSGSAIVWNLRQGEVISTFPQGATEGVNAIAISANGQSVFTSARGVLNQWDARRGRLVRTVLRVNGDMYGLAISPDGKTLAVHFGNYIHLRDIATNRALYNLPANAVGQQVMTFSPDSAYFISTDGRSATEGISQQFRVWRLPTR